MTSTTVLLAKEKGAKLYKEGKFSESIGSYSVAIENTDSNDPELHLYYRCAHKLFLSHSSYFKEEYFSSIKHN